MPSPNILIVMTDHQRADTVLPEHGCLTPNLDRLGREGVAFTETHCPTPHCCPSRATFFSGLYPSQHGVWNNICNDMALSRGLKDGVRLWSEDLRDAGYDLAYTGKWHVSTTTDPKDHGWRELSKSSNKGALHGKSWESYREEAASPDPTERGEGEILRPGWGPFRLYGTCNEGKGGDAKHLQQALEELPKLAAGDAPWCLYVGWIGPHDPYKVPQKYLDMYALADVPLPPSYADMMEGKPGLYKRMRHQIWGQLSEREVREGIRHFWAYCTYLDDMFGQLLDALDATGQADDTLVIYTSDHGDYCGDHGLFAKSIPCFRGAYHVPNVMRWPNGIAHPGRRVDDYASLADFAPTLREVAGLNPAPTAAGASLMPFLQDQEPDTWRDEIHTQCNGVEVYACQRSVTTRDWKYVYNAFDEDELYDLRADPHEMVNVSANAAHHDVKHSLVQRMWRFAAANEDAMKNPYITIGLAPWGPREAFR